jgi:hypothetical protein
MSYRSTAEHLCERKGLFMIESDLRPLILNDNLRTATIAYVPNDPADRHAGYLYLLASEKGPLLGVPGIIGAMDGSEPDTDSAVALIGRPISPWELRNDGWYAEIL